MTHALALLLQAAQFAADKHRDHRRKDGNTPYINHPLEVGRLLAEVGGVEDVTILVAALLHDTIEDTDTTGPELEARYGPEVRSLVEEVTDDTSLPKAQRKRLQIEHAPGSSEAAKLIKLADKISNVWDVSRNPPRGWSLERRREYLEWTSRVIAGCRETNPALEELYDRALAEGLDLLARQET